MILKILKNKFVAKTALFASYFTTFVLLVLMTTNIENMNIKMAEKFKAITAVLDATKILQYNNTKFGGDFNRNETAMEIALNSGIVDHYKILQKNLSTQNDLAFSKYVGAKQDMVATLSKKPSTNEEVNMQNDVLIDVAKVNFLEVLKIDAEVSSIQTKIMTMFSVLFLIWGFVVSSIAKRGFINFLQRRANTTSSTPNL